MKNIQSVGLAPLHQAWQTLAMKTCIRCGKKEPDDNLEWCQHCAGQLIKDLPPRGKLPEAAKRRPAKPSTSQQLKSNTDRAPMAKSARQAMADKKPAKRNPPPQTA